MFGQRSGQRVLGDKVGTYAEDRIGSTLRITGKDQLSVFSQLGVRTKGKSKDQI